MKFIPSIREISGFIIPGIALQSLFSTLRMMNPLRPFHRMAIGLPILQTEPGNSKSTSLPIRDREASSEYPPKAVIKRYGRRTAANCFTVMEIS
jgi:hypothetical protein